MFVWMARPGEEIICPPVVLLKVCRPDGTVIMQVPLNDTITSIEVNRKGAGVYRFDPEGM